jgi:hypothetical protein
MGMNQQYKHAALIPAITHVAAVAGWPHRIFFVRFEALVMYRTSARFSANEYSISTCPKYDVRDSMIRRI